MLGVLCAAATAGSGPDVLFLNSYHPGLYWSDQILAGVRTTLLPHEQISVEFLDTKHSESQRRDSLVAAVLENKYRTRQPRVILSSDDYALRFLTQWRDSLFPGVPVVFCGINNLRPDMLEGLEGFAGVGEQTFPGRTMEWIRRIFPRTTDVWVVTERSATGLSNRRVFDSLALRSASIQQPIRFHFLDSAGPPRWEDLTARISSLGPGNVLFWSELYNDRDGIFIDLQRDVGPFLGSLEIPVFVHQEMFVLYGAIGGICNRGFEHGQQAGRIMRMVLDGADPDSIPTGRDSSVAPVFDWPTLQRFGIREGELPVGTILLRAPVPIWQSHPWHTGVAVVVVLFLAGILVGLSVALGRVRRSRKALLESEAALRDSESGLRRLFDTMTDAVMVHSDTGEILFMNKGGQRMYGLLPEDVGKFDIMALSSLESLSIRDFRELMARASAGEDRIFEWKARQPISGVEFDVEVSLTRITLRGQQHLVAVVRDVRERMETRRTLLNAKADLERQVDERTRALLQANRELEAFSYSVSHDLRAPLRSINGFAQALGEDLSLTLSGEHADFLARIRNASARMGEIIDDLLHLSHITTSTLERTEIDMDGLVRDLVRDLRESAPDVSWEIQPLQPALGDLSLLKPLWTNLLSNAIKYSSRKESPVVAIANSLLDGKPVWTVRDNGAGFDMAHAHHLFVPFRRLHHADEFQGTGIGLAIVHRIVSRHGGKVWAEAAPDEGAAFHFTLG